MGVLLDPDHIKSPQEYVAAWREARARLLAVLEKIDADSFQKKQERGWNASEIAEHLYLTQWNIARVIPIIASGRGGLEAKDCRKIDYTQAYDQISRPQGYKNPESVAPSGTWDAATAREYLKKAMEKLEKGFKDLTLDKLRARGIDHPLLGNLTLLDWLWVMVLHEGSHTGALAEKYGIQI